jgi:hypothetical protein
VEPGFGAAHDMGVGIDGPDLVVPTGRRRRQLGEHGTGLLGGLGKAVAAIGKGTR